MQTPSEIAEEFFRRYFTDQKNQPAEEEKKRFESIIACALDASLMTEEGVSAIFSILVSLSEPLRIWRRSVPARELQYEPDIKFEKSLPMTKETLAKYSRLSKAGSSFLGIEASGSQEGSEITCVGRWPDGWRNSSPAWPFSTDPSKIGVTVLGPAYMIIEGAGGEILHYRAGAIEDQLVNPFSAVEAFRKCLGATEDMPNYETVLNMLVRGMWLARRGGILAFCSDENDPVLNDPVLNSGIRIGNIGLSDYFWEVYVTGGLQAQAEYERDFATAYDALLAEKELVNVVADCIRLSTVDGALIVAPNLTIVSFGCKLASSIAFEDIKSTIDETGYLKDNEPGRHHKELTGTRHASSACWVAEREGRVAIVVSQDSKSYVVYKNSEDTVEFWRWRPPLLQSS